MKIYVASSWRNEHQQGVVAELRAAGHEVYDFKNPGDDKRGFGWKQAWEVPAPWSAETTAKVLASARADEAFASDMGALRWAEAVVMVQPCGRSAALELGWAAGAGKHTCALLADGQEPELMVKMADAVATDMAGVHAWLRALNRGER